VQGPALWPTLIHTYISYYTRRKKEMSYIETSWLKNSTERDHLGNFDINGKEILKYIVQV
jgi:hypothetical protein